MEERQGEAFEEGVGLTVVGRRLQPGEAAHDYALDTLDAAGDRFELYDVHLHSPAEHTFVGTMHEAELHFVHKSPRSSPVTWS